jgi:hypothetical protein
MRSRTRRVQKIDLVREAKIIRRLQERASKRFIADIVEIGKHLAKVKAHVGHGQWLPWLQKNFSMSVDTAERYISVSYLPAKIRRLRNLDLSVLYLLAKRDTPREMFDDVVKRSRAGEPIKTTFISVTVRRTPPEKVVVPYYREDPEPVNRVVKPVYVEPTPALPAPEPEAVDVDATAFFDALNALLPPPDVSELVKAYRAQRRVSVANIRELVATLQELERLLLDNDAAPTNDGEPRVH